MMISDYEVKNSAHLVTSALGQEHEQLVKNRRRRETTMQGERVAVAGRSATWQAFREPHRKVRLARGDWQLVGREGERSALRRKNSQPLDSDPPT